MSSFGWNVTNPGFYISGLLTGVEQTFVTNLVGLSYATGDILYYDGTSLTRLPIGSASKVLTVTGGIPSWEAAASGFADPLTTNGDIIARISGVTTRLAQGGNGTFLGVSGGVLGYYTPSGTGNVSKVGTPVDNQIGVWTGDGTIEGSTTLTFDGDILTVTNNNDIGSATALVVQGDRLNPTANDEVIIEMRLSDSAGNQDTMGTIRAQALDVTSTSEDSQLKFGTVIAGTLASRLALTGTELRPNTDDAVSLGNATANRWSDLFLASGGVINFNNGNATLTHSAGLLTSNVDIVVPDEAYGAGWNGSLEVPTKNALYDKIETLGGSGNVSKVGTPADNQIGVWTGDGTIEGTTNFTFDGGQIITVPDTVNKVGLKINQNDGTNDPSALVVNGPAAGTAAKVTSSTLVQFNDETGSNSDWSFRVAGTGYPTINLASSGGTLASPSANLDEETLGSIQFLGWTEGGVWNGPYIAGYVSDATDASLDDYIFIGTNLAGTGAPRLVIGDGINGIGVGTTAANAIITSRGNNDLILQTGNTTTGNITIVDGANGNISLTPNGTGAVAVGTTIELGHASDTTLARVSAGVVSIEGNNILTSATGLPLAGGTMSGNITLGENTAIALDPAGSAAGKWSGITVTGTAGYTAGSGAFGDIITLDKDDSRWEKVDISVAAAATGDARGVLGVMLTDAPTDGSACNILLHGIVRADANFPALTIGAEVYASTTGDIVVAQPTTTDYVIRQVGYAMTADEIYFNPTGTWATHT